MIQHNFRKGFTLIEMMLSMAFIAMLLVSMATVSRFVLSMYTKGMTVREVNQSGRLVVDDIQRTIESVPPFDIAKNYIEDTSGGGRLCTGSYSYAWNYGKDLKASQESVLNKYSDDSTSDQIRLVRVRDAGGSLCADLTRQIERADAKELLSEGDRDLVVHRFRVAETARDDASKQALYSVQLTIGTNDSEQLGVDNSTCLPPTEGTGTDDYCSLNSFNFVIRAGSKVGGI